MIRLTYGSATIELHPIVDDHNVSRVSDASGVEVIANYDSNVIYSSDDLEKAVSMVVAAISAETEPDQPPDEVEVPGAIHLGKR